MQISIAIGGNKRTTQNIEGLLLFAWNNSSYHDISYSSNESFMHAGSNDNIHNVIKIQEVWTWFKSNI